MLLEVCCFVQPAVDNKVEADIKYRDTNRNTIYKHYFSLKDCMFPTLMDYSVPSASDIQKWLNG